MKPTEFSARPAADGHSLPLRLHKTGRFLRFPAGGGETVHLLEILCDGVHWTELAVAEGEPRFWAALPLPACSEVTLDGDCPFSFYESVGFADAPEAPDPARPLAHYAPPQGWCNDPNGLVWENGVFHFYYQYNPCGTAWNNMSWGAARTRDFLHWDTQPPVLLPDARGSVFSGCALRNERGLLGLPADALLYFYTAAGQAYNVPDKKQLWSAGRPFTQNYACSLDGGASICRPNDNEIIGGLGCEARDPKVFWYAPRQWYCMVLFLDGNRFAVLHSRDLRRWEQTQELTLPGSWECPDLFVLPAPDGSERWVFWSADGYYYLGRFDGERFHTDCTRHLAYRTALPYAAQTWSGVPGARVISIPWMRTPDTGAAFTGMYGIPREFSLAAGADGPVLRMRPAAELLACARPQPALADGEARTLADEAAVLLHTQLAAPGDVCWEIFGQTVRYDSVAGTLHLGTQCAYLAPGQTDFSLLADRGLLEASAGGDTLYAAFAAGWRCLTGTVRAAGAGAHTELSLLGG